MRNPLTISAILEEFEEAFTEEIPNDWRRFKSIRIQEPFEFLRQKLEELVESVDSKIHKSKESYNLREPDYQDGIKDGWNTHASLVAEWKANIKQ